MHTPTLSLALTVLCAALVPAQSKDDRKQAAEAAKAAKAAAEAKSAEYKAKGYKKVKDVWVAKEHLEDAKKGIYHHDGEILNHYEILQIQAGKVRHPVTGEFIAAADLEQAQSKFLGAKGQWVTKEVANMFHSDRSTPWVVRTGHCTLVSTLPVDTLLLAKEPADLAVRRLLPLFGGATPPPNRRPTVLVLKDTEAYRRFGEEYGDEGSAHGAFLTPRFTMKIDGSDVRVGATYWHDSWGPYNVRHAAGIALTYSICGDKLNDQLPEWFPRALGGYVERLADEAAVKWFGDKHKAKGGIKDVAGWLKTYKISPQAPENGIGDVHYNIFQAGLMIWFGMRGGNAQVTDALQKVSEAFKTGKKVVPAVKAFGKAVADNESDFKALLDKMTK